MYVCMYGCMHARTYVCMYILYNNTLIYYIHKCSCHTNIWTEKKNNKNTHSNYIKIIYIQIKVCFQG